MRGFPFDLSTWAMGMSSSQIESGKRSKAGRYLAAALSLIGIFVSVIEVFQVHYFSPILIGQAYLFCLMSFFFPLAILYLFPHIKGRFGWYKNLFAILAFIIPFYFFLTASAAFYQGWEVKAPWHAMIMSLILVILVLIAVKQVGGWPLFIVCFLFGALPLFTVYMPGILSGVGYGFWSTITFHALGTESLLGLPMRVVGRILIGYLIFGAVLQVTGGGKFFLDFALSLLGRYRGGAAKVSIVSSSLFGSLSGSVIANIVTTGTFTIPTMKRSGFPAYYAGAVEACSSTGGVLMPPIMGATAFIMAEFLNTSYLSVCLAAVIPSILYYLTLFLQVDCYAAKNKLAGLPKEEIPQLVKTLKDGWPYVMSFMALIWVLGFQRLEAQAPYYASALLLFLLMLKKERRLNFQNFLELFESAGRTIAHIMATLLGIGFVIGSLSMTGIAFSFASELTHLAGGNMLFLLLLGAIGSYVLGMGMTVSACYIFLALVMAPVLIESGFNPMATHLFFLYCGMLSYITPPVAVGAFSAASVAKSAPMLTGWTSMRLGIGMWLLPLIFVLSPSLIFEGSIYHGLLAVFLTGLGFSLISQGAEGMMVLVVKRRIGLPQRAFLIITGSAIPFLNLLL